VRAQADQKAFSFLGRAQELKQKKTSIKIAVIGCMAQRIGEKIKKRFSCVDLIIGAKENEGAALKILNLCSMKTPLKKETQNIKSDIVRYVTIMRGCDNYCSYCVVPFVRGREFSVNCDEIINECSLIANNGAKEIILLGQNVNSYKHKDIIFSDLIKKIANIDDIKRIRFMTNHPKDLNDNLIEAMSEEPKICGHIHLPMQSASDKILEKMNRKYTYGHYLTLIKKLREAIPNISITTDIIVGFPSESKEDFEKTLNAIRTIKFDGLYVFKYSPRPDTKAAQMTDDISLEEKKRRHSIILTESNDISADIVSKMVGTNQEVLAEKEENGVLTARTRGGRKVFIRGGAENVGRQFDVIIKEAKINSLFGNFAD
jgi:tRNA-2-methylthio-N6-dimethylallyladenosine synthase